MSVITPETGLDLLEDGLERQLRELRLVLDGVLRALELVAGADLRIDNGLRSSRDGCRLTRCGELGRSFLPIASSV